MPIDNCTEIMTELLPFHQQLGRMQQTAAAESCSLRLFDEVSAPCADLLHLPSYQQQHQ